MFGLNLCYCNNCDRHKNKIVNNLSKSLRDLVITRFRTFSISNKIITSNLFIHQHILQWLSRWFYEPIGVNHDDHLLYSIYRNCWWKYLQFMYLKGKGYYTITLIVFQFLSPTYYVGLVSLCPHWFRYTCRASCFVAV